jgi:hypothetical protein
MTNIWSPWNQRNASVAEQQHNSTAATPMIIGVLFLLGSSEMVGGN